MPLVFGRIIAIMGDSYEHVKENETVAALHEQAKIIVDMELLYPNSSLVWSCFPFFGPHKYGRFMHILTYKGNGPDYRAKPWQGISVNAANRLPPVELPVSCFYRFKK